MEISVIGKTQVVAGSAPNATQQLEQVFLQEMLKYAGPKPTAGAFSGGIGEEQFSSMLLEEYGAILSESLGRILKKEVI